MPRKAFLKKKSLLDRFKDDYATHTGYIQSARAKHTWNNPLTRSKRTKELNRWIKSFAGKDHIHKLARFNAVNAGKNEDYADGVKCLRYGSSFELPDGKIITALDKAIRCRRSGAFIVYITGWVENEGSDPCNSKYTVYFDTGKCKDYFLTNDIQDLPNYQTNGPIPSDNKVVKDYAMHGNTNEAMSLKGFLENLTEKLTKQFDLDLEEVQAYLNSHTQEMQELLDDKELSLKEKVLFVRSEITGEKDEAKKSEKAPEKGSIYNKEDYLNDGWVLEDEDTSDTTYTAATFTKRTSDVPVMMGIYYDPKTKKILDTAYAILTESNKSEAKVSPYLVEIAHKILTDEYGWKASTIEEVADWLGDHKQAFEHAYGQALRSSDDDKANVKAGIEAALDEEERGVMNAEIAMMGESKKQTNEMIGNKKWVIRIKRLGKNYYVCSSSFRVNKAFRYPSLGGPFVCSDWDITERDIAKYDNYNDAKKAWDGMAQVIRGGLPFYKEGEDYEIVQVNFSMMGESKEPADEKLGYEKGHKNSKGEDAPWVIRSHEDNRVLASFAKKEDAEAHLQRMKQYSKTEKKSEAVEESDFIKDFRARMESMIGEPYDEDDILGYGWVWKSEDIGYPNGNKTYYEYFSLSDDGVPYTMEVGYNSFNETISSFKMWQETSEKKSEAEDNEADKLYIIQGTDSFTNFTDDYTQEELHRLKTSKWTDADYKKMTGLLFSQDHTISDDERETLYSDIDRSTEIGTKKELLAMNYPEDLFESKKSEAEDLSGYTSDVVSELDTIWGCGEDGAKRLVGKYADVIQQNYVDGDLLASETAKFIAGQEHLTESRKKSEAKKSEGRLELVDTVIVPKWLWEAYNFGNDYGEDLDEHEQEILAKFQEKYSDLYLDDHDEEADFHSRNDFDEYGGPCYEVDVYEMKKA